MSSPFPVAILNGTFVFRSVKAVNNWKRSAIKQILLLLLLLLLKKDWQCKAGRWRLPPYQSEDPSPTPPTYRGKEEKGKIVEDKKVESN